MRTISIIFVVTLATLLALSSGVLAQQSGNQPRMVTVDVNQLPTAQRDSILESQYQSEIDAKVKKFGWAAGLGKEIGEGVNESLKAITERTAEFAETKVGKFTMFMVAWKILGGDVIQLGFGLFFFILWIAVWIYSYWRNCITRRVVVEKGKEGVKNWEIINEWVNNQGSDIKTQTAVIHWIIFLVFAIITCIIIFS